MSDDDRHLGTGAYDPRRYWSARARASAGDLYEAVCGYGQSPLENRCMDRVHRRFMSAAVRQVPLAGSRVLEYGCGAGRWVQFFRRRDCEWHGVDISEEMLALARMRYFGVDCRPVDDERIPYGNGRFDFVYAVTVLHHNPHERQGALLSEMIRVLRQGGHLLIFEAIADRIAFNMFPRPLPDWLQLIREAGAKPVWHRGASHWVLRKVAVRIRGLLPVSVRRDTGAPTATSSRQKPVIPLWRRAIAPLDFMLDPYLQPILPRRFHSSAIILAIKDSGAA